MNIVASKCQLNIIAALFHRRISMEIQILHPRCGKIHRRLERKNNIENRVQNTIINNAHFPQRLIKDAILIFLKSNFARNFVFYIYIQA